MSQGRIIFQGEFGEILIPDILTFLDMIGKTGTLSVTREGERKRIFWDRGEIAFADSSVRDEQISDYLCLNGWIDAAAREAVKPNAERPDDLIKSLLRSGALEPAVLPKALKLLVLDIVYSLFDWHEGSFTFEITPAAYGEKVVLKTSVSNIIMEGTRRMDEWQRIREYFPTNDVYPIPVANPPEVAVKLPPMEAEVLERIDGRSNIRDIVRQVEHDLFSVLNALLTLQNAGLISSSPSPVAAPPPLPPGHGLSGAQLSAARSIVDAFGNIFAGIHERIIRAKGSAGAQQFGATIQKGSFQKSGLFSGVSFLADGRLPTDTILKNLGDVPEDERLARLKGTLDRLLAQQVLQLDTSYGPEEKKAVSELIAREKERLTTV